MKIGILGGSFDPPHIGHIYISLQVKEQLNLDHIWLMPCGKHPFLKNLTPAKHRLSMLNLIKTPEITISEFEIQKKSYSYTIDTLKELTKDHKNEYYWIIGSDQLESFQKWKEWRKIIKNYNIVIAPRGNTSVELETMTKKCLDLKSIPPTITLMNTKHLFINNLSSSFIRERLQLQRPVTYLVPLQVEQYFLKTNYMKNNNVLKTLTLIPQKETKKITDFLKKTFKQVGVKNVVLGLSGGVDSMTSLHLLKETLDPKNIIITHLYYEKNYAFELKQILKNLKIPDKNIHIFSIKKQVNSFAELMKARNDKKLQEIRIGNIAARIRMIALYDLAKQYDALVCGTENKSEYLLGYFTRFGDQASDIEPIQHLYKTQVYQLARYLKVPDSILTRTPSADLWQGQTDEGEFGFSYKEADQVLFNHFDLGIAVKKLEKQGLKNAGIIVQRSHDNHFKHITPYYIK